MPVIYGDRVRSFRKKVGFTQVKLAELIGVSKQAISRIEVSGEGDGNGTTNVSCSTLEKLCKCLGCSKKYLLGKSDDPGDFKDMQAFVQELQEFLSEKTMSQQDTLQGSTPLTQKRREFKAAVLKFLEIGNADDLDFFILLVKAYLGIRKINPDFHFTPRKKHIPSSIEF